MIAIITPTGLRPMQFNLCGNFMKRQTYTDEVVWIIIDDGIPESTESIRYDFKENWIIIKVFPKPAWSLGQNTQFRNILVGIRTLFANYSEKDIEAIFMIEDDDYYRPYYIEKMMEKLQNFDMIGEMNCVYYNVFYRNYLIWNNVLHSSLFQTVLRPRVASFLVKACDRPLDNASYYIDMQIWGQVKNKCLFNDNKLAIGIKGMPGRAGIGSGHDDKLQTTPDPQMIFLNSLIGEDHRIYGDFYNNQFIRIHTEEEKIKARREARLRARQDRRRHR